MLLKKINKTTVIKLTALFLVMSFVVFMGACSYDDELGRTSNGNTSVTPVADDFDIVLPSPALANSEYTVKITPKEGKSKGKVTVYYTGTDYAKTDNKPGLAGNYAVTFDVAAVSGFTAASGLDAGTFEIKEQVENPLTPVAGDFDVTGNIAIYDGSPKEVKITPKEGKSNGEITIYYDDDENAPTDVGTYTVTFDVAEAYGFYEAIGLSAGTLVISSDDDPIGGDPSSDASLATLTINGVAATLPTSHPNEGLPGLGVWNNPDDYSTITMTSVQFNNGSPLTIVATVNDSKARIAGYAVTSSSSNLYSGGTAQNPESINDANWVTTGIASGYTYTGSFTNAANDTQGTSGTRIFVWVEAEDGTWGFYRVNRIIIDDSGDPGDPGDPTQSSDASLLSLTINGVAATFPANHPASAVISSQTTTNFSTITMTSAEYNGNGSNSLTIVAIPNDSEAKVVGYAVTTTSGNLTSTASWGTYGTYDDAGITGGYTYTGTFRNDGIDSGTTFERIFVWVKAEDGSNGHYRINKITITAGPGDPDDPPPETLSSDASLASLTINGGGTITWPTNAHPNTSIVQWAAGDYTTITNAPSATGTITILATPTDSKAKIVGYAVTGSSADLYTSNVNDSTKWASKGTYNVAGVTEAYTWTGTFGNNRLFIWVQAEDGTNGFYRIQTIGFSSP